MGFFPILKYPLQFFGGRGWIDAAQVAIRRRGASTETCKPSVDLFTTEKGCRVLESGSRRIVRSLTMSRKRRALSRRTSKESSRAWKTQLGAGAPSSPEHRVRRSTEFAGVPYRWCGLDDCRATETRKTFQTQERMQGGGKKNEFIKWRFHSSGFDELV